MTTETDALVREAREASDSLEGSAWRRMDGGQELSIHAGLITRLADQLEALASPTQPEAQPEQVAREALAEAFEQGCIAAHLAIQNEPELALMPVGDAEFGEAATDYAAAAAALAKMGAKS